MAHWKRPTLLLLLVALSALAQPPAASMSMENAEALVGAESSATPNHHQRNTDHAVPKSRDGTATLENAQNTCRTCNLKKGTKTTEEFLKEQRE